MGIADDRLLGVNMMVSFIFDTSSLSFHFRHLRLPHEAIIMFISADMFLSAAISCFQEISHARYADSFEERAQRGLRCRGRMCSHADA